MALLSKSTAVTEDARAFLQRRVGRFGLVAAQKAISRAGFFPANRIVRFNA